MMIMGGVISSTLFTSLLSIVKYIADAKNQLPGIVYWLMGGLSTVTNSMLVYCAPVIIICVIIINLCSGYLNVLSLGDDEALSLGINVKKIRSILIFMTTLCSCWWNDRLGRHDDSPYSKNDCRA